MHHEPEWSQINEKLESAKTLLQQSSSDPKLHRKVAYLLYRLGRFAAALGHYQAAAEADPENPQAWYELGHTALQANDLSVAEMALQKAIARGHQRGATQASLAWVLYRRGQVERAIEEARHALELPLSARLHSDLSRMLGIWCEETGDDEGALVHLQDAVRADPEDAAAQHYLAVAYANRGRYRAALPHLERATRLAPEISGGWCYLAWVAQEVGDGEQARAALETALTLEPDNSNVHAQLAELLLSLGQPAAAVSHLEQAVQLAPDSPAHWESLGRALREAGSPAAARSALDNALRLGGDSGRLQIELVCVLNWLGDPAAAVRHGIRALEQPLEPHELAWVHTLLAHSYTQIGHEETALQHREQAAAAAPDSPSARYDLGVAYYYRGQFENAMGELQEAVALSPGDADAWHALGVAAGQAGQLSLAREALEKAVSLSDEPAIVTTGPDLSRTSRPESGKAPLNKASNCSKTTAKGLPGCIGFSATVIANWMTVPRQLNTCRRPAAWSRATQRTTTI